MVFSTHATVVLQHPLEPVQNRTTRLILSDYSYNSDISALKAQINFAALRCRRLVASLRSFCNFFLLLAFCWRHKIPAASHPSPTVIKRTARKLHAAFFQQSFLLRTARHLDDLLTDVGSIIGSIAFMRPV